MSVRDTSLEAYEELKKNLNPALTRVYNSLSGFHVLMERWPTDRELQAWLEEHYYPEKWPINRVTGRRNDLVALGFVIAGEKRQDANTGRTVYTWEILGPPSMEESANAARRQLTKTITDKNGQTALF